MQSELSSNDPDRTEIHATAAGLRPDAAVSSRRRRIRGADELGAQALRPLDQAHMALKGGCEVDQRRNLTLGQPVRIKVAR